MRLRTYWKVFIAAGIVANLCCFDEPVNKVFIVILENTSYTSAIAQPYLKSLSRNGVTFTNYFALTHPSQPNYIGLTAGDHFGADNSDQNLDVRHIADLLEAKGLRWRTYAEDYPGNCNLITATGYYARRHVPFLSYVNVTKQPSRCSNIVQADLMFEDFNRNGIPDFSLYIPNNYNNGHDSSVRVADAWAKNKIPAILSALKKQGNYTFILTFDEGDLNIPTDNRVLTVFLGNRTIKGGFVSEQLNHYSLLRWIEKNFHLGNLGRNDVTADILPETKIFE